MDRARLARGRWVAAVDAVRANGLEIAHRRVGEGPLLVFVHGAGEDGRTWQPQLAALTGEFTIVAWDEPGAGRSSELPAEFALADCAHCLAALIQGARPRAPRASPVSPGPARASRSSTATTRSW